ncbi:MAG TPA: hypothetical protein VHR35_17355 [Nocardioides sp.]|jgi:hypothetical protein|nr:hypothetical protein [Nocardioides sp.]
MLSLEDRSDPVAVLGSLMNAEATNRLTVVFDRDDHAGHPALRAELDRLVDLGYLSR